QTGEDLFRTTIDASALAGNPDVHLLRDDRWVYIALNQPAVANVQFQRQSMSGPYHSAIRTVMINGPFYAVDPADGRIAWSRPDVKAQALIVNQFDEVPLILCATMQVQWRRNNAGQPLGQSYLYNILALDKRDGSVVFEEEKQGNATTSSFNSIKVDSRLATVELTSQNAKLIFRQANEQARR